MDKESLESESRCFIAFRSLCVILIRMWCIGAPIQACSEPELFYSLLLLSVRHSINLLHSRRNHRGHTVILTPTRYPLRRSQPLRTTPPPHRLAF